MLPSEDVLDRPEFDAREFINRNFPDEQSLGDIGDFVSRLRVRMKELDDSLSQASQDQSLAAHQALVDLKEAKMATQQLFHKIHDIRGKAEQSEVMVQEICRDIKQLDYAKRHLQTTLTALKRLHMLVNAVDQLEFMSSQRNYREAASLLEAVNQLFSHFDGYTSVGKIVELHKTVRTLQEELGDRSSPTSGPLAPWSLWRRTSPLKKSGRQCFPTSRRHVLLWMRWGGRLERSSSTCSVTSSSCPMRGCMAREASVLGCIRLKRATRGFTTCSIPSTIA